MPTPLTSKREPDLSYVENTTRHIAACLRPGQLVSLESTTYPGTTAELLLPILGQKHKVGEDFYLVFSPEREDPGNPTFQVNTIPKVVGGVTPGVPCARGGALLPGDRPGDSRVLHPGGGNEQAAGEHLPGGQHCPGQ